MLSVLAACSRPPPRGELEFLVSTDIETLDPRHATDAISVRATRLIHAGLFRLDESTLAPLPNVAAGATFVDPLTLRVDLRRDVFFHSGKPVEPADVVATFAAYGSPAVAGRYTRVVEPIANVSVTGEHQVEIHLKHPHATLLADLEVPLLRADQATAPPDPEGALDGLGPYEVSSRGSSWTRFRAPHVASRDNHPASAPRSLIVRTIRDENARALRLLAGRADIVQNAISPSLLPALEREPKVHVT